MTRTGARARLNRSEITADCQVPAWSQNHPSSWLGRPRCTFSQRRGRLGFAQYLLVPVSAFVEECFPPEPRRVSSPAKRPARIWARLKESDPGPVISEITAVACQISDNAQAIGGSFCINPAATSAAAAASAVGLLAGCAARSTGPIFSRRLVEGWVRLRRAGEPKQPVNGQVLVDQGPVNSVSGRGNLVGAALHLGGFGQPFGDGRYVECVRGAIDGQLHDFPEKAKGLHRVEWLAHGYCCPWNLLQADIR